MQKYNALQQLEIEAKPIETGSYFFTRWMIHWNSLTRALDFPRLEFLNEIGCSPKRYVQVQPQLLDLKEEVAEGIPMACVRHADQSGFFWH